MKKISLKKVPCVLFSILFVMFLVYGILWRCPEFIFEVNAIEITVDSTILDGTDEYNPSPSIVYTSSLNGYSFYIDATSQDLAYSKTTNGGNTWGTATVIDTTVAGWTSVAIWYDQWTPGDSTGTKIHIAASDDTVNSAAIYYTYLDTSTDTLKGSVVSAVSGTTMTEASVGVPSIVKGTGGALFISGNFTTPAGGKVSKCTDSIGDSWSDVTPSSWSSVAAEQIQLLPLVTGNDIIAIKAQTGDNTIRSRIYNETDDEWEEAWSGSIAALTDSSTYDQWFSATINKNNGNIHLLFANYTANAANDIEYWYLTDSARTWTAGEDLFTDDATVMMPIPLVDLLTNDIYAVYLRGTVGSNVSVYYKKLSSGDTIWTDELQILSNPAIGDDYRSLRGNIGSAERLAVLYYDDDDNVLYSSTVIAAGESSGVYIDSAIIDATDEYGPSPSLAFVDQDTGYQFFVKNDIATDGTDEFGPSPAVVFTDANTGYVFYINASSQDLAYKKTTDAGATWSGTYIINTTLIGWTNVSVWYDQWTPGDTTGTKIHIAASDDASDDIYYTYLDVSDDTIRSGGVVAAVSGTTTLTEAVDGPPSITKDGSGELFISANFTNTVGGKVSKSTNGGDNWSDITPSGWSSVAADQIQLLPLLTDNDLIAIRADTGNDDIDYQTYEDDVWSGTWNTISTLVDHATYDQWFSASIKKSTGNIYLTTNNYTANAVNDIEFWTFSNSARTWSQGTNVLSDNATVLSPVPVIDEGDGKIYVAYIRGTINSSTRVYFKSSTDGGSTWSAESATISPTLADDYKYLRGNLLQDDIPYVIWHNDDTNVIKGNSLSSPLTYDNPINGQSVVYRKTTNGGMYWGQYYSVASTLGTTSLAVWYDQWTPGDTTGSKIHIVFSDDQTDDYYYTYFDTTYETFPTPKPVLLGTAITELNVGVPGITKGGSGNLFLTGNFNTPAGGLVYKSTDNGASWSDTAPSSWSTVAQDQIQLLPLLTGNDIIAIKAETGTNTIKYRIYDETTTDAWDSNWSSIGTLVDNTTYDQWFSASLKKSTGDIYLSFANYTANAENDIEFWSFDESNRGVGFSQKTNVIENSAETISPVPFVDESNGNLYVAYLRGTLEDIMGVYYKKSTDGGTTWNDESSNLTPGGRDDHKYIRGNLLSTNRLFVVWYNDDLNALMGSQIDMSEDILLSVTVSDGGLTYGIVPMNTSRSTLPSDLNDVQVITNNSNVIADFSIKGSNTTGASCTWVLASSSGSNEYVNEFCNDTSLDCSSPPTNYTALTTIYQTLAENVAISGEIDLQMRFTAPTDSTCNDEHTFNVTILVSE